MSNSDFKGFGVATLPAGLQMVETEQPADDELASAIVCAAAVNQLR
jgi:hypothetical protein